MLYCNFHIVSSSSQDVTTLILFYKVGFNQVRRKAKNIWSQKKAYFAIIIIIIFTHTAQNKRATGNGAKPQSEVQDLLCSLHPWQHI